MATAAQRNVAVLVNLMAFGDDTSALSNQYDGAVGPKSYDGVLLAHGWFTPQALFRKEFALF